MTMISRISEISVLAAIFVSILSSTALADLSVNPRRIVLEDGDNATTVTLMNRGVEAETYRIYWVYRRMGADLGFEAVNDAEAAGTADAAEMIRYSPRQVTLGAGESQTVRLLVRRPPDIQDGEYRAHLMFEREPQIVGGGARSDGRALQISMHVAYGISIPVIIRHQPQGTNLSRFDARVDGQNLVLDFEREGNASLFGELEVTLESGGQESRLLLIPNFAVYTEVGAAQVSLPLNWPADGMPDGGSLRVELRDAERDALPVLAQDVVALP